MKILLQQEAFIAVDKPPGIPVIPGRNPGPCVQKELEAELKRRLWIVHRLDRDTSGVLIFALDEKSHRRWSMAFEHHKVSKVYLALVEGNIEEPIEVDAPLAPARRSRMKVLEGGKRAVTRIRPVEKYGNATLVEAEPLTGRLHQIRVHLSHVGHPLLFDHQYRRTEVSTGLTRTPLHAARLQFEDVRLESPLPEDMVAEMGRLGPPK